MIPKQLIQPFTLSRIPEIRFGAGIIRTLPQLLAKFGDQMLIVTGGVSFLNSKICKELYKALIDNHSVVIQSIVTGEPSPELVDKEVTFFKSKQIDIVIAIGGGSVIDAGKAISAMLNEDGSVADYLEGVGTGKIPSGLKVPFIAVPTTAGTGSEATKNAVLSQVGLQGYKRSLRHDNFIPDIALIDPELMLSLPANLTATCGMDALTQLMEAYLSPKSNPMIDALAFSGMEAVKNSLESAVQDGAHDIAARTGMAYASLLSGIALAQAGLGIVHGLASPIGGYYNIPHGVICGTLLAPATEMNIQLLRQKGENDWALYKYARIGALFGHCDEENVDFCCQQLIEQLYNWTYRFNLPMLSDYGIKLNQVEKIVVNSDIKNNPVRLSDEHIAAILKKRIAS
jgi:alcohol dehydrogenase class IV